MLTAQEENYILAHAYVPEHVVGLITSLSAGEPFLIEDHFFCHKHDWIIFIGYPLQDRFDPDDFESVLEKIKSRFKPARISLIAPALPDRLISNCRERDSDYYYTLDTRNPIIRSPVKRNLRKAARRLTIERAVRMGDAHQELMHEFVRDVDPPVRVKNLLFKMPQYIAAAPHAFVFNAWGPKDELAAFYVIDLAAENFANYIIGCYSKQKYVLGASDLLLMELIKISNEFGKRYIHLGLGVNRGIRRFKEKWGAKPSRNYEMCELTIKKPLIMVAIRAVIDKALSNFQ
ncbi:hypothetical protein D1BOALGB6SA_5218 [Olavius sp. associated proteobacterium Delta 1]|nr:hypothetical protein D1BOALGB6SA_5218 [Olavius sp. associated proteobacterium Delta 1]